MRYYAVRRGSGCPAAGIPPPSWADRRMTIPMLFLLAVVIIATVVGIWALVHEHEEATKVRRRARVWEARAYAARQNGREQADERARLSAMTPRPLTEEDLAQFRASLR